jgi:WD40 repeat protein
MDFSSKLAEPFISPIAGANLSDREKAIKMIGTMFADKMNFNPTKRDGHKRLGNEGESNKINEKLKEEEIEYEIYGPQKEKGFSIPTGAPQDGMKVGIEEILAYQMIIREKFKTEISPETIKLENQRYDFLQYSRQRGVLLVIENQGRCIVFIDKHGNPKYFYNDIKESLEDSSLVTSTALIESEKYLFVAKASAKIYQYAVNWKGPNPSIAIVENVIKLSAAPIYIGTSHNKLYVASYGKYEILEISLDDDRTTKVIDRFKNTTQIKAGGDKIAYSNASQLRVYSKHFGWQEFEKNFKASEFKKCIFEFNKKGSYFAISIFKTIKIYETRSWSVINTLTSDREIKGLSFTEDGHWIAGISDDYTIYIWYLLSTSPTANFITRKFVEVSVDSGAEAGRDRTTTIKNDQSKVINHKSSDPSYEIIVDQRLNKIYCFGAKNEILSYSGPFLDYYLYKKSNLGSQFQTISLLDTKLILRADKERLLIWETMSEQLPKEISLKEVNIEPFCSGMYSCNNSYKYIIGSKGAIYTIRFDENYEYKEIEEFLIESNDTVTCIAFSPSRVPDKTEKNYFMIDTNQAFYAYGTSQGHVFVKYEVETVSYKYEKKLENLTNKEKPSDNSKANGVTAIDALNHIIVAGHQSGLIRLFIQKIDSNNKNRILCLDNHKSAIQQVKIFAKKKELISACEDIKCIIWCIEDGTPIKSIDINIKSQISSIQLNKSNSIIISTDNGMLLFYEWPSLSKLLELKYKCKGNTKLLITEDSDYLIVSNNAGVFRTKNPMSEKHLRICGSNLNIPKLYNFIKLDCFKDIKSTSNWTILPYTINCLHYYAYRNDEVQIKEAFNKKIFYLETSRGLHPLKISLICKNIEASAAIISSLRKKIEAQKIDGVMKIEDRYALETLDDCLIDLNSQGFRGLDDIYRSSLIRVDQDDLPDFCLSSIQLPKISFKSSMVVQVQEFFKPGEYRLKNANADLVKKIKHKKNQLKSNQIKDNKSKINKEETKLEEQIKKTDEKIDQRIVFYTSCFTINTVCGSESSIEFLDSILNCTNTEIFSSKFIKIVLQYKKSQINYIIIILTLLNALLIIPNCLFIAFGDIIYLRIYLIMNIFLLVYEIAQIIASVKAYFFDPWSYVDLCRNIILYTYPIYYKEEWADIFLVIITVLTFFKGITCFSLFSGTRYLISLLREAMKETIPFGMIVLYSTFAFAFVKLSISRYSSTEDLDIIGTIRDSYLINIGEFDTSEMGYITYLVFVSATIINLVLLMNLLISILGGVVDRVQERSEVEDQQSLASIILEVEKIFWWNREKGTNQILHICELSTPSEIAPTVEMMNKFKSLKDSLKNVSNTQTTYNKDLSEKYKSLENKIDETKKIIETSKKETMIEMKSNNNQLKILISDNTAYKGHGRETIHHEGYICLNDHKIPILNGKEKIDCGICKKSKITEYRYCGICNFYVCKLCSDFFNHHNKNPTDIKCYYDHILLYFPDLNEFYKHQKYFLLKCRMCDDKDFEQGYHCLVCIYSICEKCKKIHETQSNKQRMCKKHHQLKWTQEPSSTYSLIKRCDLCIPMNERPQPQFDDSSLEDTESKAKETADNQGDSDLVDHTHKKDWANELNKKKIGLRAGAGFFICNLCNITTCTSCFKREYLDGDGNFYLDSVEANSGEYNKIELEKELTSEDLLREENSFKFSD